MTARPTPTEPSYAYLSALVEIYITLMIDQLTAAVPLGGFLYG